jgi:TonB family protein
MNTVMNSWAQEMLLWSWQSLLLVGLIFIAARIAPTRSATARHSLWLLAMLVIAVLPIANALTTSMQLAPPVVAPIAEIAQLPTLAVQAIPAVPETTTVSTRDVLIPVVFALWVVGVVVSGLRSIRTRLRWRRIVASASRIEHTDLSIPVGYSTAIDVPVLVGVFRPMILLPADIEQWTNAEERRAALSHELAHLERRDHWLSVGQAILGAIFFFHPGVRYALRQLIVERELACDERVLAAGASRSSYAEIILKVAERTIPGRQSDCPAMHTSGEILERRIDMILTHQPSKVNRRKLPALARAAMIFGFATLLLPQAGVTAELPLAPSEIRLAGLQPFFEEMSEGMSLMAKVISREPEPQPTPAEPAVQAPVPAPTAPQVALGTVSGTVSDQSGAVVPGVTVTLTGPAGLKTVITNEIGRYMFPEVPAGQHTLQTRLPGFMTATRTISVSAGSTSVQDLGLRIANVSTTVEISVRRDSAIQAPPQPAAPAPPIRVGGNVVQANLLSAAKPVYPPAVRAAGIQDYVMLKGIIGTNGLVLSLQPDNSRPTPPHPDLVRAAMDAVQQWRYRPASLNGVPVEIETTITLNFSLTD